MTMNGGSRRHQVATEAAVAALLEQLCAALNGPDEEAALAAARRLCGEPCEQAVRALIEALGREDAVPAEAAQSLAEIGVPAAPWLIAAMHDHNEIRRWHVAKALAAIALPEVAPVLVAALHDPEPGVRWEAVRGLAAVGRPALEPLLRALCFQDLSPWFATGAQRVLRRLAPLAPELKLRPLFLLLEHVQSRIAVPLEAHRLLDQLTHKQVAAKPEPRSRR